MKSITATRPMMPASTLFRIESWPRVGPTVRLCTTSSGTSSAPDLSCRTSLLTSSGGIPSMIPWLRIAPLMLALLITCLSTTTDMYWPMCELVKS